VALAGEKGGGIGGKFPPRMLKMPWFQNKHWGTLTKWIWPIFWVNIQPICLLHSHISYFLMLAYQFRASENKTEK